MDFLIALCVGFIAAVPDLFWEYHKSWPEWLQSPNLYFWLRGIETLFAIPIIARGKCSPLLVFGGIVGPGLIYRIWLHYSTAGGVNNLAPVAIGFELLSVLPALLICLIVGAAVRRKK